MYDPQTLAEALADRAARGTLDFTPASLPRLSAASGTTAEVASYYAEVVRRTLGGEWHSAPFGVFPRLAVGEWDACLELDALSTATLVAEGDPEAIVREYAELLVEVQRGYPEVFDDAKYHLGQMGASVADAQAYVVTGMVVRWLFERGHLIDGVARQVASTLGTPGEVFRVALGGRLTSHEVKLEPDQFLRAYLIPLSAPTGLTSWGEDLVTLGEAYSLPDDGGTYTRVAALLDQRWAEWQRAGRPTPTEGWTEEAEDTNPAVSAHKRERPEIPDGPFEVAVFEVAEPWPLMSFTPGDDVEQSRLDASWDLGLVVFVMAGTLRADGFGVLVELVAGGPIGGATTMYRGRGVQLLRPTAGGFWQVRAVDDDTMEVEPTAPAPPIADVTDALFWMSRPSDDQVRSWMQNADPVERMRHVLRILDR
jgi:hypothetical protein